MVKVQMGVNPKIGGFYPPNHPFGNRGFPYFHHLFWGTTIFGNTQIEEPPKLENGT